MQFSSFVLYVQYIPQYNHCHWDGMGTLESCSMLLIEWWLLIECNTNAVKTTTARVDRAVDTAGFHQNKKHTHPLLHSPPAKQGNALIRASTLEFGLCGCNNLTHIRLLFILLPKIAMGPNTFVLLLLYKSCTTAIAITLRVVVYALFFILQQPIYSV